MKILSGDKELTRNILINQLQKGKLSIDVVFPQDALVGQEVLRRLLSIYKTIFQYPRANKDTLKGNIIFKFNRIKNFDLSFLCLITLFRSFPSLTVVLQFINIDALERPSKEIFQLGHFMTTSMADRQTPLFKIIYKNVTLEPNQKNLSSFLTSSTQYIPLILIDQKNYEDYFNSSFEGFWKDIFEISFDSEQFESLLLNRISNSKAFRENIYQACREIMIDRAVNIFKTRNALNFDRISCILSFIHALRKIGVNHLLLKSHVGQIKNHKIKKNLLGEYSLGIRGFTSKDNRIFQDEMERRIKGLFNREPFFILIFSLFVENSFNYSVSTKNEVNTVLDSIDSILSFTAQLFDGLRELTKNVVEHATSKRGVLSLRLFKPLSLRNLKNDTFFSYIDARTQVNEFVDIILMDDSEAGILEQTINKLSVLEDEFRGLPEHDLIKADIASIADGKMTLKDFFVLSESPLLHQEIRSAASLGLLIFSDFLLKNDGITYVSSINKNNILTAIVSKEIQENIYIDAGMPFGTYYNIIIPVSFNKPLRSIPIYYPYESTAAMDAYEELAKIEVLTSSSYDTEFCRNLRQENKRCLHLYDLEVPSKMARICLLELKENSFCTICPKILDSVTALRLKDNTINLDPSLVFRSLSQIQHNLCCKSVIVYNIKEECLRRLLNILMIYEKITGRLWSNDQFILFYYIPNGDLSTYLSYHVWIVGGERLSDTFSLNSNILRTNKGCMLINDINKRTIINGLSTFNKNPLFSSSGHLLPFDVILREGNHTLFEYNVLNDLCRPIQEE